MLHILYISVPVALALLVVLRLCMTWLKYRGARLVTCPENQQPAGVAIDIKHATKHAAWSVIDRAPALRLDTCSRWPERHDCGQECLRQIELAPDGCLVRNILAKWYEGKNCAICGQPFTEIQWADHKPALWSPEQRTVAWSAIRPEAVPHTLETHLPVCWNCHIVQTFCREHPDLVVDRSRTTSYR
jgi:hypothetical protein